MGVREDSRAGADDRTRQPRGDQRRQQILDAAVELFSAQGYRGTGVAALAERVGMTATGLLYYFGSKARLLEEVVAERDRQEPNPAGFDLRLEHLRAMGRYNSQTETLTRLYIVLAAESFPLTSPLHDFFVERYESTRAMFRELVEKERAAGNLRPDVDPEQVSREILGAVLGFEMQWLMDPESFDYAETAEAYFDRLVRDLLIEP